MQSKISDKPHSVVDFFGNKCMIYAASVALALKRRLDPDLKKLLLTHLAVNKKLTDFVGEDMPPFEHKKKFPPNFETCYQRPDGVKNFLHKQDSVRNGLKHLSCNRQAMQFMSDVLDFRYNENGIVQEPNSLNYHPIYSGLKTDPTDTSQASTRILNLLCASQRKTNKLYGSKDTWLDYSPDTHITSRDPYDITLEFEQCLTMSAQMLSTCLGSPIHAVKLHRESEQRKRLGIKSLLLDKRAARENLQKLGSTRAITSILISSQKYGDPMIYDLLDERESYQVNYAGTQQDFKNNIDVKNCVELTKGHARLVLKHDLRNNSYFLTSTDKDSEQIQTKDYSLEQLYKSIGDEIERLIGQTSRIANLYNITKGTYTQDYNCRPKATTVQNPDGSLNAITTTQSSPDMEKQESSNRAFFDGVKKLNIDPNSKDIDPKKKSSINDHPLLDAIRTAAHSCANPRQLEELLKMSNRNILNIGGNSKQFSRTGLIAQLDELSIDTQVINLERQAPGQLTGIINQKPEGVYFLDNYSIVKSQKSQNYYLLHREKYQKRVFLNFYPLEKPKNGNYKLDTPQQSKGVDATHAVDFATKNTFKTYSGSSTILDRFGNTIKPQSYEFDFSEVIAQTNDSIYYTADFLLAQAGIRDYYSKDLRVFGAYNIYNAEVREPEYFLPNAEGKPTLRYSNEVIDGEDRITCSVLENGGFNTKYSHKAAQEITGDNKKFYASHFSTTSLAGVHKAIQKATKKKKIFITHNLDLQLDPLLINGRTADFVLIDNKGRKDNDLDSTEDSLRNDDKLIVRTVVFEGKIEERPIVYPKSDHQLSTKLCATGSKYVDMFGFEKATACPKSGNLITINSKLSTNLVSNLIGQADQIENTVNQVQRLIEWMDSNEKKVRSCRQLVLESSRLQKIFSRSRPRLWLEAQGDDLTLKSKIRNFFYNSQSIYKMDTCLPIHSDDYNYVIEMIFKIEVQNSVYSSSEQDVQKDNLEKFHQPNISSKELTEISYDIAPYSKHTIERMIEIFSVICQPGLEGPLRKRYQQRSGLKVTYEDLKSFNFFEQDWNYAQHTQDLVQENMGYLTRKDKLDVLLNGSDEKLQNAYQDGKLDKFSGKFKRQMHDVGLGEKDYQRYLEANKPINPMESVYHGLAHTKIGDFQKIRQQKQPYESYDELKKSPIDIEPAIPSRIDGQFELITKHQSIPGLSPIDEISNYNNQLHTLFRIEHNQNHMFAHIIQKIITLQESEGLLSHRSDQLKQLMANLQKETPVYGTNYNTFIKDIQKFMNYVYSYHKKNEVNELLFETSWMNNQSKENKVQALNYPSRKNRFFKNLKRPQYIEDYSYRLAEYCESLLNTKLYKEFLKIYRRDKYLDHDHYVEWLNGRKIGNFYSFRKKDFEGRLRIAKQNESVLKELYGDKITTEIFVVGDSTRILSQDDFTLLPEESIIKESKWYSGKGGKLDIIEEEYEDDSDEDAEQEVEQEKQYEAYQNQGKKKKRIRKQRIQTKDPDAQAKYENRLKKMFNKEGIFQGRKEQAEQSKGGLAKYYSDYDKFKDENPDSDEAKMVPSNLSDIGDRADALVRPYKNKKSKARFYQPFHEAQLTDNQNELKANVISDREKRKADKSVKDNPSPKMIEVTQEYWIRTIKGRRRKRIQYQNNGQQPPGVRFNDKNAVETFYALEKRQGCAQVKPKDKWQSEAFSVVSGYLKEIIYEKGIHVNVQSRYNLQDYIDEVKSKDPVKGQRLQNCLEVSKKHKIRGLKSEIDFFQKNPLQEPKTKGQVVKPRGIANNMTCIKSKKVRRNLNKKDKMAYESYYNLYCNYISHVFIDCIKEGQSYVDPQKAQKATFTHGLNTSQLTKDFIKNYEEMVNISGGQEIAYHSSDFGKFDAFRSKKTLINFDNKQLAEFMSNVKNQLPSVGFYPVDYLNTLDQQFQTDLDVTHKDSFKRVQFTARIQGTVPSGFGPRTTLGNTLFNMAYQQQLTRGQYSRSFAAGDDGAFIILKKDVPQIRERVKELTSDNNNPKNDDEAEHGLGLLIDDTLNFDSELITFQSKIIDIKSNASARLLERVAATGCITSSKVDMKVINYCNNKQQEEYFPQPFYNGIEMARSNQEQVAFLKEPDWNDSYASVKKEIQSSLGKNCKEQNPNFIKEFNYKRDARPTAAPSNYLKRVNDATGGQRFTHNVEMDELVGSLLANINQSNQN